MARAGLFVAPPVLPVRGRGCDQGRADGHDDGHDAHLCHSREIGTKNINRLSVIKATRAGDKGCAAGEVRVWSLAPAQKN